MNRHLRNPRDPRRSVCGTPTDDALQRETDDPTRTETCEDCLTLLPDAARPDDASHPAGGLTLIDILRRVVADRRPVRIDGVLIDLWSASVTVLIWEHLRADKRQRLPRLPSHELILRCIDIYTRLTTRRDDR